MDQKSETSVHGCPMHSTEYKEVESRLEQDAVFRFDYVASVIGLEKEDFAAVREFHDVIEPYLETIVKRVYEKMFDFRTMKRHFVPKHDGFPGNAPGAMDDVTLNHA